MKKIVSLILAVVMMALMLPLSAVMVAAETSDTLDLTTKKEWDFTTLNALPEDFIASLNGTETVTFNNGAVLTKVSDNGVGIQMNKKLPNGVAYTVTVKFTQQASLNRLALTWKSTAPTTTDEDPGTIGKGATSAMLALYPTHRTNAGTIYTKQNNSGAESVEALYRNGVSTPVSNEKVLATDAADAGVKELVEALAAAGAEITLSVDVDATGKMEAAHVKATGTTAVYTYDLTQECTVPDCYLGFWMFAGGTATIKSISIEKQPATKVVGLQYTEASENKQNIRFVSTLASITDVSKVGFKVEAVYRETAQGTVLTKTWDKNSSTVYESIQATASGTVASITAKGFGKDYFCALSVGGVPTTYDQIDFYVTPYVIDNNGIYVYGAQVTATFQNGAPVNGVTLLTVPTEN